LGGRALAEDVEFDLTKAAGEGNLLWGRNSLVAEEDDGVSIKGPLYLAERRIVQRPGQIDATNLGAEYGICRDDFNRHGWDSCWSRHAIQKQQQALPPWAHRRSVTREHKYGVNEPCSRQSACARNVPNSPKGTIDQMPPWSWLRRGRRTYWEKAPRRHR